jgi:hypothetical protein
MIYNATFEIKYVYIYDIIVNIIIWYKKIYSIHYDI